MRKVYNSFEELSSYCDNSGLKVCVSSVLARNKYVNWELLSCSEEGDVCRADFVSRNEVAGTVSHLSYELNGMGQFGHIAVETLAPSAAKT